MLVSSDMKRKISSPDGYSIGKHPLNQLEGDHVYNLVADQRPNP